MSLNKYLVYSTLFGIFSEALLLRVGFDLKFIYLIVMVNSGLLVFVNKFLLNKELSLAVLVYFILGIFSVFFFQNKIDRVYFQIFGIFLMGSYFYTFFRYVNISYIDIFKKYCVCSYYLSLIGILFFLVFIITGIDISFELTKLPFYGYPDSSESLRLRSIFLEPAHFAGISLPALYYYLVHFKRRKRNFLVIFIALILTFSTIAYVGIALAIIISLRNQSTILKKIVIASFIGVSMYYAYVKINDFSLRIGDTYALFFLGGKEDTPINLSTYTLYSNFFVTFNVLRDSPFIGHGIGSHPISYNNYIGNIPLLQMSELNKEDANSLTLRILSELGIVGLLMVLFFIKKNYVNHNYISQAILLYFWYKLFREGHYFSPEMYFFVFLYFAIKRDNILKILRNYENSSIRLS